MKNETVIAYNARNATPDAEKDLTMLFDARIRLAGRKKPSVSVRTLAALEAFLTPMYKNAAFEELKAIAVDAQLNVIAVTTISEGDLSVCSVYPRKIAAFALLSNAHGIMLAHNHPGGTCTPSCEDITATGQVRDALRLFGIYLWEHVIYAGSGKIYSMSRNGDIKL